MRTPRAVWSNPNDEFYLIRKLKVCQSGSSRQSENSNTHSELKKCRFTWWTGRSDCKCFLFQVASVIVIHVPDDKYKLSARILFQYLLTSQGSMYELKVGHIFFCVHCCSIIIIIIIMHLISRTPLNGKNNIKGPLLCTFWCQFHQTVRTLLLFLGWCYYSYYYYSLYWDHCYSVTDKFKNWGEKVANQEALMFKGQEWKWTVFP